MDDKGNFSIWISGSNLMEKIKKIIKEGKTDPKEIVKELGITWKNLVNNRNDRGNLTAFFYPVNSWVTKINTQYDPKEREKAFEEIATNEMEKLIKKKFNNNTSGKNITYLYNITHHSVYIDQIKQKARLRDIDLKSKNAKNFSSFDITQIISIGGLIKEIELKNNGPTIDKSSFENNLSIDIDDVDKKNILKKINIIIKKEETNIPDLVTKAINKTPQKKEGQPIVHWYEIPTEDGKSTLKEIKDILIKELENQNIKFRSNPMLDEKMTKVLIRNAIKNKSNEEKPRGHIIMNGKDLELNRRIDNPLSKISNAKRGLSKSLDIVLGLPAKKENGEIKYNIYPIQLKTTYSLKSSGPAEEILKFLSSLSTTMAVVDGLKWRAILSYEENSYNVNIHKPTSSDISIKDGKDENGTKFRPLELNYLNKSQYARRAMFTEDFVPLLKKINNDVYLEMYDTVSNLLKNANDDNLKAMYDTIMKEKALYSESFKETIDNFKNKSKLKNFMDNYLIPIKKIRDWAKENKINNLYITANSCLLKWIYNDKQQENNMANSASVNTFTSIMTFDRKTLKERANNIRDRK